MSPLYGYFIRFCDPPLPQRQLLMQAQYSPFVLRMTYLHQNTRIDRNAVTKEKKNVYIYKYDICIILIQFNTIIIMLQFYTRVD